MQREQLIELVDTARAADRSTVDRAVIVAAVAAATRLVAWCDSQQIVYAQALDDLGAVPENVMAQASRSDARDVERVVKRADTANKAPCFAEALATADTAGEGAVLARGCISFEAAAPSTSVPQLGLEP